jgi:hypothetical protein
VIYSAVSKEDDGITMKRKARTNPKITVNTSINTDITFVITIMMKEIIPLKFYTTSLNKNHVF